MPSKRSTARRRIGTRTVRHFVLLVPRLDIATASAVRSAGRSHTKISLSSQLYKVRCNVKAHFRAVSCTVCNRKVITPKKVGFPSLQKAKELCFLRSAGSDSAKSRFTQVPINGTPVSAKVDAGAKVPVLPSRFLGIPVKLDNTDIVLTGSTFNSFMKIFCKH